ncbi:MAG: hypothetical protein LAQ69_15980 [Acidobacteriia bacterium]|nr:hypothetical protein [Terriglobia bacterium]
MAIATKPRRGALKRSSAGTPSKLARLAIDFAPGSLEADLSAIGKSAPAQEWAKVPGDYFSNLDYHLHGAEKDVKLVFADTLYWGAALHPHDQRRTAP